MQGGVHWQMGLFVYGGGGESNGVRRSVANGLVCVRGRGESNAGRRSVANGLVCVRGRGGE